MAVRGSYYHLISFTDLYSKNENCGLLLTSRVSASATFTHKPISLNLNILHSANFIWALFSYPLLRAVFIVFSFKK